MENNRENTSTLYAQGSSLLIKFQGLVARPAMLGIRAAVLAVALANDIDRVLIDLSGAFVALSHEDWRDFTRDCASREALRLTTALLVPPLSEEAAWEHAERMSDYGRLTIVFADRDAAYRWAGLSFPRGLWVATASAV